MKSELLSPQVVHLHPDQDKAQIGTYPNAGLDNAKPPLISLKIWKGVHFAIDGCRGFNEPPLNDFFNIRKGLVHRLRLI